MSRNRIRTAAVAAAAVTALALTGCGGKQDRTSDTAATGASGGASESCLLVHRRPGNRSSAPGRRRLIRRR